MDAIDVALSTANSSFDTTTVIFDMSCEEMSQLAVESAGGAFDHANGTNWVNFAADPSTVFPSAASDLTVPTREQLCTNLDGSNVSADTKCYCPSES